MEASDWPGGGHVDPSLFVLISTPISLFFLLEHEKLLPNKHTSTHLISLLSLSLTHTHTHEHEKLLPGEHSGELLSGELLSGDLLPDDLLSDELLSGDLLPEDLRWCSGYRGIPVHLLLGPVIGPSSAQERINDPSPGRRPSRGGAS
jgi:hypothetical protein